MTTLGISPYVNMWIVSGVKCARWGLTVATRPVAVGCLVICGDFCISKLGTFLVMAEFN